MDADQLLQAYARGVEHGMRNTSTTSTTELQEELLFPSFLTD